MGQEIDQQHFHKSDFQRFDKALQQETELLQSWYDKQQLADSGFMVGFELEGWLLDKQFQPAPLCHKFIEKFASPLITPELAKFNVEFNTQPRELRGNVLNRVEQELTHAWKKGQQIAQKLDNSQLLAIGILPTVTPEQLCIANMAEMNRYRALNEQVMRLRQGKPLNIDITGQDHLQHSHHDLMLESAATSFQIHLQTPIELAARHYNASKIVSAPLTAIAANSPFLFNHSLWDESRIPLFEQAVEVGSHRYKKDNPHARITFGDDYIESSLLECFQLNLQHYEVLLPIPLDESPHTLEHLRLHNGTIWRWNRPLVGFDQQGRVHLRIEHRPLPAGPSIVDMVANAAFYFGLVRALAEQSIPPEQQLSFECAKENFYHAAKNGLEAKIKWLDGRRYPVQTLILDKLIPLAKQGLTLLNIDEYDQDHFLGIIQQRATTKQNGSNWQRQVVLKRGMNMQQLTQYYSEQQQSNLPVHQWPL